MRVLGLGARMDLRALYLALAREGHEIRVHVSDPVYGGAPDGLVQAVTDWRAELEWVGKGRDADGIVLFEGNHGSTLAGNTVTHSLVNGIRINLGARENVLTGNTALDNATDVRDLDLATNGPGPTSNQWIRTTCRTSVPAGLCVSTATDGSVG